MNIYTFILTSLIIILIPGTGVIYTISTGITKGKKASTIAALGCTAGITALSCKYRAFITSVKDERAGFLGIKTGGCFVFTLSWNWHASIKNKTRL